MFDLDLLIVGQAKTRNQERNALTRCFHDPRGNVKRWATERFLNLLCYQAADSIPLQQRPKLSHAELPRELRRGCHLQQLPKSRRIVDAVQLEQLREVPMQLCSQSAADRNALRFQLLLQSGQFSQFDEQRILDGSVHFYGAQRSGDGANWLLSGATCHMNDGESIQADLAGGWYDAGDHVKVTLSIAYASYVMLKAFDAFPAAFADRDSQRYDGAPNGVPDVLDEARYATDYLVKAHLSETELVGMVGNANSDHRQWVGCAAQEALPANMGGRPRPVSLEANADIAGITAASLAIMSRLYRPIDAALADSYQLHATQIYQIGKNNPQGSNPGLYGQNGEAWIDEMLAGSAELYRLTSDAAYLTDALDFNTRIENHGWAPNYSQSADYSRHSLFVGGQAEAVSEFWKLDVENYAAKVSTNEFTAGAVYFDEWGMLRYSAGAGFSAALYAQVTGDTAARDLAISQLNYIAGENGYARSFVIGVGPNAPQNPHHRNSHTLGILLTGALVAGPTQRGYTQGQGVNALVITTPGYEDVTEDYVGNEVALDYNAGLVGLGAFGVLQQRAASGSAP
jgi:endoglucanase